jgi:Rod binding domain-containing protein
MEIASLQRTVDASQIPPEQLAGNSQLSQREKIGEASRQFEAVLLQQILESTQKTVIKSKYADDSTSSAIYRDQVTSQLAQSISKSGTFGLAKVFDQQLTRTESPALKTPPQVEKRSGRVSRAASGVRPDTSTNTPRAAHAKEMVEHSFRRDTANRTPEACAPHPAFRTP